MGDAALHLAVDHQRIDDVSAVVGDGVTQELHAADQRVDLDLRHVRPVAIGGLRRGEIGRVLEAGGLARGEGEARHPLRGTRKLPEHDRRLVAAARDGATILDVDVALSHAEHAGGERDDLLAHACARDQRR